jgi:hypothetical protein
MVRQRYKLAINSEIDREPNSSRHKFTSFLSRPFVSYGRKIRFGLRKAVIPNLMYSFHPNDTRLWYLVDGTLKSIDISSSRVFENGQELADHLTDLFSNNGDSGITVTLDNNTKKLSFNNNTGVTIRIVSDFVYETEVNGTQLFNHANVKLGLTSDLSQTNIPDGSSLTPVSIPRLASTNVYHILSRDKVSNDITVTPSPNDNPHILASVLVDKSFGDLITIHLSDDEIFYFEIDELYKISIEVTDDQFRPIDLNGGNVYLEFEYSII